MNPHPHTPASARVCLNQKSAVTLWPSSSISFLNGMTQSGSTTAIEEIDTKEKVWIPAKS